MNSHSNIIKMIRHCVIVLLVVLFPICSLVRQVSAETITITWSVQAANQGTKTVTVGSTVIWVWGDNAPHNVLSTNSDFLNSPLISGLGSTYNATFNKAGSYPYYCSVHTRMEGIIEVVEAIVTSPAEPSLKPISSPPPQKKSTPTLNNPNTIQPSLRSTQSTVPTSAAPSPKLSSSSRNWYYPTKTPPKSNTVPDRSKPWMMQ